MSARFILNEPPRRFRVGVDDWVEIKDCGRAGLSPGDTVAVEFAGTGTEALIIGRFWGCEVSWSHAAAGGEAMIAGRHADRLHVLLVSLAGSAQYQDYRRREGMMVEYALRDIAS